MRKTLKWSKEEEKLLEELYENSTIDELRIVFPYRTDRSISRKANNMGLTKNESTQKRIASINSRRGYVDKFPHITREILYELYINKKLSTRDVGKKLGCGNGLVIKRLKMYGIPVRKRVGDESFTAEERRAKWGRPLSEHNLWRGGVTPINDILRTATNEWRYETLKSHNFRCIVTGEETHDLHVHHVRPFYEIRDEAIAELGLSDRNTVSDCTDAEIESLKALISKKHEGEEGYPIKPELHRLFHSLYGNDTSRADFYEFKARYQSGEFNELQAVA